MSRYIPGYNPLTRKVEIAVMAKAPNGHYYLQEVAATIPVEGWRPPEWAEWVRGVWMPQPRVEKINAAMAKAVDLIVGGLK